MIFYASHFSSLNILLILFNFFIDFIILFMSALSSSVAKNFTLEQNKIFMYIIKLIKIIFIMYIILIL